MLETLNNLSTQDHHVLFQTKEPDPFVYQKYLEWRQTGQYPYIETVAKWLESFLPSLDAMQAKNLRTHVYYSSHKYRKENIKTVLGDIESIQGRQGDYIRFGGNGIIDGLKQQPCKFSFYEIKGIDEHKNLLLRKYRGRKLLCIPVYNQDQEYEIITASAFRQLPEYA